MNRFFSKLMIVATVLLSVSEILIAGNLPPITSRLQTGATYTVSPGTKDTVDLNPKTGNFSDYEVADLITFGYDHASILYTDSFSAKVVLAVQPYDQSNSAGTPFTTTLSLTYQPFNRAKVFTDKSIYRFTDAYKFTYTVSSVYINSSTVTAMPSNLFLEGDIVGQRYYDFSLATDTTITMTSVAPVDTDCDSKYDEVAVTWNTAAWAEEYQLEWTFVNDYGSTIGTYLAASSLEFEIKNNSTRVSTTNSYYNITLAFEHGYVLFRVRGIGRDHSHPTKIITGPWNLLDRGVVSAQPANNKYHNVTAHEHDKNWVFTGTFAEEGKKREVVSYFDGSHRGRQTVTKNNSDKTTLISQTIYDYQGRPAVTVLPSPVSTAALCNDGDETSIHFYPKFNRDDSSFAYLRNDFDVDSDTNTCVSFTPGMNTGYGASNYYSPANPDNLLQQAFVPDAQKYPFSRVEYTPDNTGRIRRQGGVGEEFQLDNGHETKYFYGQPNQLQLDRLFGSEVGDATHYKKNMVVDPNGQISITYLDQQGRTIATSLAGEPPANVAKLPLLDSAKKEFLVDLLAHDANGKSNLNSVAVSGDALVFSSQLLVGQESNHDFRYVLQSDTLFDACLSASVCIGCVYNFDIKVIDECGINVGPNLGGDTLLGHFELDSLNRPVFSTECHSPSVFCDSTIFTKLLTPGNYTVSKTLTVNPAARTYYLQQYLDSSINTCAKTKSDFIAAAVAALDTSGCNITCELCAASLGNRDTTIASGAMSDLEYDALMEECQAPCKKMNWCELVYEQLLLDVAPSGQYAEYRDNAGAINPGQFSLSVFNTGNILPINFVAGAGNWKTPKVTVNGNTYSYYLNDDNTRTTVALAPISGGFSPAVDAGKEIYDPSTNTYFTYPEFLANVSDFISLWQESWARSLVQFHPEYCYYTNCKQYADKHPGEHLTSNEFDQKLLEAETFQQAVSDSLIKGNYASITIPDNRIQNYFASSSLHPYDPFATSGSFYQIGYPTLNFATALANKFNNYVTVGGNSYSMIEAASIITRCGTLYNVVPNSSCQNFGKDYYSPGDPLNDSIRDKEWHLFKMMYLSEKYKIQKLRADEYGQLYCYGYNGCIGNSSYNPFATGMISTPFTSAPFFNFLQPCGIATLTQYIGKQKRFPDYTDFPAIDEQQADYQVFLQTGQCPMVQQLQGFLNGFAGKQLLDTSLWVDLTQHAEFTQDLYYAITDTSITDSTFIRYKWRKVASSADTLNVDLVNAADSISQCSLRLIKTGAGISNWDEIAEIRNVRFTNFTFGYYNFTASAMVQVDSAGFSRMVAKTIRGRSCIKLNNCKFPFECEANEFAQNVSNLMSALAFTDSLTGAAVDLTQAAYSGFVTPILINTLQAPDSNLRWHYVSSTSVFHLYHVSTPSHKLEFRFLNYNPISFLVGDLNSIKKFTDVAGNYQHYFTINGRDANDSLLVQIEASVINYFAADSVFPISMGVCGQADPLNCNAPAQLVRKDFEALLKAVLSKKPFEESIDLVQSPAYTSLLRSNFGADVTSTSSTYTQTVISGTHRDTLTFSIPNCTMFVVHSDNNSPARDYSNLVDLINLRATGAPDANNNQHSFTAIGVYKIGTTYYKDIISGYTCLPLQNCVPCEPYTKSFSLSEIYLQDSLAMDLGELVYLDSIIAPSEGCEGFYEEFLLRLESYNNSDYAQHFNDSLDEEIYPTYESFEEAGMCACAGSYYNYLAPYVESPADTTLPLPVDINNFGPCLFVLDPPVDSCALRYQEYLTTVEAFNTWANEFELYTYTISFVQSEASFAQDGYCYCLDQYQSYLRAVIDGVITDSLDIIRNKNLNYNCAAVRFTCNTQAPPDNKPSPFFTKFDNPCAEQLLNIAIENAETRYAQYVDSLTTAFAAKYNAHCVKANELYTVKYDDKEYHFTLYYYDQAGNLVRTVPPEGINAFDITSYADAKSQEIAADRANNTHLVYTDHHIATTYEYNSLGQLVKESLPDHDKINSWEYSLTNGLDSRLKIVTSHFVSESRGYLTGYITIGGIDRGYVYTTNDGGANWARVNNQIGVDFAKIQLVNDTGYAVGAAGTVMRTLDGGGTWDLFNTYENAGTNDLQALYFINGKKGVVAGKAGAIFTTTNACVTFSAATGISSAYDITSVTHDGTNYFATAKDVNNLGYVFKSSTASTWTLQASQRTTDILDINFIGSAGTNTVFASGKEGLLLKSTDGGTIWNTVSTGLTKNIRDIAFIDNSYGLAVIDSSTGYGQLYTTTNGGATWSLLSGSGEYYNSIYQYSVGNFIAAGNAGNVKRVVFYAGSFGTINISPSGAGGINFATAWAKNYSGSSIFAIAAGNSKDVYFTNEAEKPNPFWFNVSNTAVTGSSPAFKKIVMAVIGNTLTGTALYDTQKLAALFKTSISDTSIDVTISDFSGSASHNYLDLSENINNNSIYTLSVNAGNYYLHKIALSAAGTTTVSTYDNAVITPSNSLTCFVSNTVAFTYRHLTGGESGELWRRAGGFLTPRSFTETSPNTVPPALHDLIALGTNTLLACGDDGVLVRTTNGSSWQALKSGTATPFKAIAFTSGNDTLVGGDSGALLRIKSISGITAQLESLNSGTTNNITDIAVKNSSGIKAYITAQNGTINYIADVNSPSPVSVSVNTAAQHVNGLAFSSSNAMAIAVGSGAAMYNMGGASGAKLKELFLPKLNDIHFADASNGYIVGLKGSIRKTANGGSSWNFILPTISSGDLIDPYAVFTYTNSTANIAGERGYVAVVSSNTVSSIQALNSATATAVVFTDIDVKNNEGYIVGTKGTGGSSLPHYFYSSNGGSSWTTSVTPSYIGKGLNGVFVFDNGNALAVGKSGSAFYLNGSTHAIQSTATWPSHATTTNLNDVFFHDDKNGYIVGDGGLLLRSTGDIFSNSTITGDSTVWAAQPSNDIYGVNDSTEIDIKTVFFPRRYNGFVGGSWNTATTTPNYARLIHDESFMYSVYHWYDRLGRLILSQNTRQYNISPFKKYSYTVYDALGRIVEVGEKGENEDAPTDFLFRDIFGTYVNGYFNKYTISDSLYSGWYNGTGSRTEVTHTYYDTQQLVDTGFFKQENLRKRVATVTYEDTLDGNDTTYQHALHFTYDLHGNVKSLLIDNQKLWYDLVNNGMDPDDAQAFRYKKVDYEYDLISGKVNTIAYQQGKADRFYHH
ncbi:MAG: hypothetical protein J0M08_06930, partial [Bacteroidetes bacterium]|nr:hypothetical protein [Bacteroidota bacterium]